MVKANLIRKALKLVYKYIDFFIINHRQLPGWETSVLFLGPHLKKHIFLLLHSHMHKTDLMCIFSSLTIFPSTAP
jgi:hypothetical protein